MAQIPLSAPPAVPPLCFPARGRGHGPRVSLAAAAVGALLACLGGLPASAAQTLYTLETRCSIQGAPPVACTVEASDSGKATTYRHRIGERVKTVRVSVDPSRMEMWDPTSRSWRNLRNAEARFSTNTVCFNGRDLCVVNANYLNSLLEDRPDLRGRDFVQAHFGPDGRVDVICYDAGCALLHQKLEQVKP
jgi:hypothetical protein